MATALVTQDSGACTWHYATGSLPSGTYTVAFTNQAAADNPTQTNALTFVGTAMVNVTASGAIKDFGANRVLHVGPGRAYQTVSAASQAAQDGDVIEIDAGTYNDDISVWRQNSITLRGVGGYAHLNATKQIPYTAGSDQQNGMGIWVTKGNNITVENIEFSGASVPDQNGAGIRAEGNNLTICHSYFHDNENGLLGGAYGTMLIEYSEFNHNGLGEYGRTHNIYVDDGDTLIFRDNYSHRAYIGHNLKTRAKQNYILYNRIMDEMDGQSSYDIDIPNGGLTYIIGNLIQQGPNTDNSTIVAYGAEGLLSGRTHDLYVVNNTIVNDNGSGTFLDVASGTAFAKIINNIFAGGGTALRGPGTKTTNLETTGPGLVAIDSYDYHLTAASPARDAGTAPGIGDGYDLTPLRQYVWDANSEVRPSDGKLDIGAYEYAP